MPRLLTFLLLVWAPMLRAVDTPASPAEPEAPATVENVSPALPDQYDQAVIAEAKTSIYIGAVTLTMPPFQREGERYTSSYQAKVFPFFFYNEKGTISINVTDDNLRQLAAGERVYFDGEAFESKGEPRRIEGHADPADASSGKIKVRVWVSKNIELIFNTTYQFNGGA
ncbi:hypothetical protein [Synoicihabitans lomoniglobus]|uniref:Uncharacterized protein n=1 Tax=Synoicihabitans lomoniglobus TaxID=2909285 RepID=A0AAE9ZTI7_9BACT|nr:hypothetical protein [Opitutaceae bacterium LMO-M01]WED63041.1 hypothetical protein PXH66_11920 [Opitutaceae bacterium LMO-M01]